METSQIHNSRYKYKIHILRSIESVSAEQAELLLVLFFALLATLGAFLEELPEFPFPLRLVIFFLVALPGIVMMMTMMLINVIMDIYVVMMIVRHEGIPVNLIRIIHLSQSPTRILWIRIRKKKKHSGTYLYTLWK